MSGIFIGNTSKLFYSTDQGNNLPNSPTYVEIDQLAEFPQVKINSSTTQYDTYNEEYVGVLAGNKTIDSINIVVHYVPGNVGHQYLDAAFASSNKFQIKIALYENPESLDQHYAIINGYISSTNLSGNQNEVVNKTYVFTAEDVIARGTAQDMADLKLGDYGVGANGLDVPQYESATPAGNSFIKVPSDQVGNPVGVDLLGIANVDGSNTTKLAITESGTLGIYITNQTSGWQQLTTSTQMSNTYVPLTRTVNGKALSSNIVLSSADTGSLALTGGILTGALTGTSATFSGAVTAASASITGNLNLNTVSVSGLTTLNGDLRATTATFSGALSSTSFTGTTLSLSGALTGTTATFTSALTADSLSLTQPLSVENGGTGNITGNAPSAVKLATARTIQTDLTSTSSASFDGTANITPGVSGILPIANGGTGASTALAARTSLSAAKSGANSDITSLTALSGPLRLGGDGQADSDATTLRQLIAATAGGGSGGATLNGVMNNFLGAVEFFNGSRAALPSGHRAADGQILNRADFPDLWNAISTGIFVSVTEANWQASASNRGMYSTGDGSTTFRMPDLNGTQSGSIKAAFLRGDSGLTVGAVATSAIPNITGGVSSAAAGAFNPNISSGSFTTGTASFNGITPNSSANQASNAVTFDASRSSSIYTNGVTEVRPNSVAGIWLIRVNGLFSAANTNFNVINGMTTNPATGAVMYGGDVRSNLQLNGNDYLVARLRSKVIGGGVKTLALSLADSTGSSIINTEWTMPTSGGELALSTDSRFDTVNGKTGGSISSAVTVSGAITTTSSISAAGQISSAQSILVSGSAGGLTAQGTYMRWNETSGTGQGSIVVNPGSGTGGFVFRFINRDNTAQIGSVNMYQNGRFAPSQGYCSKQGVNGNINTANAWNIERGTDGNNYLWIDTTAFLIPQSTSDLTYKTDITDSKEGALDRVLATKTIEYSWNEKANRDDKRHRGFGAQYQEVIDELHVIPSAGSAYPMSLDTVAMLADSYDAIKTLDEMIRSLQEQVANLQQTNK